MTGMELFEMVEADEELEGTGITSDGRVIISCPKQNGLKTSVTIGALGEMDWKTLRAVCVGEREPQALNHVTRVVGYFSRVSDWNKSKVGELKDRRKGNYAIA